MSNDEEQDCARSSLVICGFVIRASPRIKPRKTWGKSPCLRGFVILFPPRVDLALFDSRLISRTLARAFIVKIVLFVCTGNICRSPIAEGLFCRMLGNRKDIEVASAGVHAVRGQPPSLYATRVCEAEG